MNYEEPKYTSRNFQYIEFEDYYGTLCQLQQSSLAEYDTPGTSAVWLGVAGMDRMHLDRERCRWLIEKLTKWLETGRLFDES